MFLLFQALDDKQECVGVYTGGRLIYDELPDELTKTWSYSSFLEDREVEYASLYCQNQDLSEVCPEEIKEAWATISSRMRAYLSAFKTSQVSLNENCFFDLVPPRYLMEFCALKNKITEHVLETCQRPDNYTHLLNTTALLDEISYQRLNINTNNIKHLRANLQTRQFIKKLGSSVPYCKYKQGATVTGRLTTAPNSFPILTLKKELRAALEPQNNWFIELDFNAAELRVALSLLDKPQPKEDLHDWNMKNVFSKSTSREQAKKRAFAWLYNPVAQDAQMDAQYDRQRLLNSFWDGQTVYTCYGRQIPADAHHALNYGVQSTCADMVLEQAHKIREMLKSMDSKLAFIVHDSIVIDFADKDRDRLKELVCEFSSTRLGNFVVNISAGKNFGSLRKLRV